MPEIAEIHLASALINQISSGRSFRSIVKSAVSKMKDPNWNSEKFMIHSSARGKELQMVLTDISSDQKESSNGVVVGKKLTLTFGFGMSGKFSFDRFDKIPKHAHLQFFTTETPANVLSFVDYRRFGTWDARDFDFTRGPDPILSPKEFRHKVLSELDKSLFDKAICEVIMDQRYFNGLGNYLRAEILFRAKIPPFSKARDHLENLPLDHEIDPVNPDLLDLCTIVPKEVFGFTKPAEGYNPASELDVYAPFKTWLRCYMKPGMNNLVDRQNRTVWFRGPAGSLTPAKKLTRHTGQRKKEKAATPEDDEGTSVDTSVDTSVEEVVASSLLTKTKKKPAKAKAKEAEKPVDVKQIAKLDGIDSKRKKSKAVAGETSKSRNKKSSKIVGDSDVGLRRSKRVMHDDEMKRK